MMMRAIAGAVVVLMLMTVAGAWAGPAVVSARFVGTGGEDAVEAAAFGGGGSLYIVGNTGEGLGARLDGVAVRTIGDRQASAYGSGFVAKLSDDGKKVLACLQLGQGAAHLTSVTATDDAVYVGGYANEGMMRVAGASRGWRRSFEPHMKTEGERRGTRFADGREGPLSHLTGRHGDYSGQPFVMKLDRDLQRVLGATWLEGRHYVWKVADPIHWSPSTEYRWTPTDIAVLPGGDVVVLHDEAFGDSYYLGGDSVSRLAGDLSARRWKVELFHPVVDPPSKVGRHHREFRGWQHKTFGQMRSQRLRSDGHGNFAVCGWSVSRTSREPWWCPFLWKFDAEGKAVWKAYTVDPMSGGRDRLGGLVSDASLRTVAFDDAGNVLAAGAGDGGNNILLRDPLDYQKTVSREKLTGMATAMRGRTLFVGTVVRLEGKSGELIRGDILHSYAGGRYEPTWAIDLAGGSDGRVVAVGRHTKGFRVSEDAWHQPGEQGGFLRVYGRLHEATFTTSLPSVDPYAMARRGDRYAVVGAARAKDAPVTGADGESFGGGVDGSVMVVDVGGQERKGE